MAVKTQNNGGDVVFIIQDGELINRIFPHIDASEINPFGAVQKVHRQVKAVLSVALLDVEIEKWMHEQGLKYRDDYYWNWRIDIIDSVGSGYAGEIDYSCHFVFRQAKYASLFRLRWL